jgi:hypothetical protein
MLGLFLAPRDGGGGGHISPKRRLTFNELYGVISNTIELLESQAVFQGVQFVCYIEMHLRAKLIKNSSPVSVTVCWKTER